MSRIIQHLSLFLQKRHTPGKAILLGLSGGVDSMSMLYALESLMVARNIHLIAVHVDHRWRKESWDEAQKIKKNSEAMGIECRVVSLEEDPRRDESIARRGRLEIFKRIYLESDAQALILAHQADDLAETVLKRVFEGGNLGSLGGMSLCSFIEEMVIWRPFLSISKKELFAFCEERRISYIDDYTNRDVRYLRARMRQDLLPVLEAKFGKNMAENLSNLSASSYELDDYMNLRTQEVWKKIERKEEEMKIPLYALHPFEGQWILRKAASSLGIVLGVQHLRHIIHLSQSGACKKYFFKDGWNFLIHKGDVIITRDNNTICKK